MQSPDPFVASMQGWMEVFMHRSMSHFMRYARNSGLTMPQLGSLFHIHYQHAGGVTDLGVNLGVTSAAASQLLERLVQQGLILRSEDPNDRRAKQLVLTEKGLQTLHESIQARQGWLNDLASTLSDSEKEQVLAAINTLIEKTKQLKLPEK